MGIKHTFKYLKSRSGGIELVTETRELTQGLAIKFHCLDCSGGVPAEVRNCEILTCPLYPFRPYNPDRVKRQMSDEQRAAASKRLKAMHAAKMSESD